MQSIEEAEAKAEAQIKALQQTIITLTDKNEEWKKWAAETKENGADQENTQRAQTHVPRQARPSPKAKARPGPKPRR